MAALPLFDAGPYEETKTGALGDKRSSMLESELQLLTKDGKVKDRRYLCWPGPNYMYGVPYPPRTETSGMALRGWPGSDLQCPEPIGKRERDFVALNRGCCDIGLSNIEEFRAYRRMYDARRKPPKHETKIGMKQIFPDGIVFGVPTRPATPMAEIMEHRYQKCWIQQQIMKYINDKTKCQPKRRPPNVYNETRTSKLRRYTDPVEDKPLWHMPRFTKNAKPALETFVIPHAKEAAVEASKYESIPRQGAFPVHRTGIHQPAKS